MSTINNTVSSYKSNLNEFDVVVLCLELFDTENNRILHLSMDYRYYTTSDKFSIILPKNMDDIVGSTIQSVKYKYDNGFKSLSDMCSDEHSFVVTISTTNGEYTITLNNLHRSTDKDEHDDDQEYHDYYNDEGRRYKFIYGDINIKSRL